MTYGGFPVRPLAMMDINLWYPESAISRKDRHHQGRRQRSGRDETARLEPD